MSRVANQEIADFLKDLSVLMELKGENAFRIRAYTNASRTFEMMEGNAEAMLAQGSLTSIKGVGKGLAELVSEFVQTGTARDYEELKASIPAGLLDMLRIQGLGPKKIRSPKHTRERMREKTKSLPQTRNNKPTTCWRGPRVDVHKHALQT